VKHTLTVSRNVQDLTTRQACRYASLSHENIEILIVYFMYNVVANSLPTQVNIWRNNLIQKE